MFKSKKTNRNFRRVKNDSSDEENQIEKQDEEENVRLQQHEQPKQQQQQQQQLQERKQLEKSDETTKEQPKQVIELRTEEDVKINKKILSFVNEDELNEEEQHVEFKVKKSKESRRLAKEVKKSKQQQQKLSDSFYASVNLNENNKGDKNNEPSNEDIFFSVKPLRTNKSEVNEQQVKGPKFLRNRYEESQDDTEEDEFKYYKEQMDASEEEEEIVNEEGNEAMSEEKLRRLRKEMEILNGDDMIPVENETDSAKRSMKLMLKSGIIPDASLIHAARKKREMERQGDYIPVRSNVEKKSAHKSSSSRLVREDDEEDLSDDEEPNKPLSMNYKEIAHQERQSTRHQFLAYEQGSSIFFHKKTWFIF